MTSGHGGAVEIDPIGLEHFERWHDLRRQAFGGTDAFDPAPYEQIPPDRALGAFVDGVLCASVVVQGFRQTWGGISIPCGGVAGVVVAPEARGRGLARWLLAEHLTVMRERGEVVSALYPTTASLYRSTGYEVAGEFVVRTIANSSVATAPASHLRWERVGLDDHRVLSVHSASAAVRTGWMTTDGETWDRMSTRWKLQPAVNRYAYVGSRDGADVAAVVYRYSEPDHAAHCEFYVLDTEVIAATDADAWTSLLAFLASQSTTAAEIRTGLPTSALLPLLPQPQKARVRESIPWMMRLVDVCAAIEARPVPESVSGSVSLDITDDSMPANAGSWTLDVGDGNGTLTKGGDGGVALTIQTLARVYAGADVGSLANAGLLPGASRADLGLLAATFAGTPELQFFF